MTKAEKTAIQTEQVDKIERIERIVSLCSVNTILDMTPMHQTMQLAHGIRGLMAALDDDVMQKIVLPLINTPLGIMTDRMPPKLMYTIEEIRTCCAEALLRGFRLIGNEVNIISGKMYAAKNGLERLVHEFPGVTEVRDEIGAIEERGGNSLVAFRISWHREGVPDCVNFAKTADSDTRIQVKGTGSDLVGGKATRKAYFRVHRLLTGNAYGLSDEPDDPRSVITTSGSPLQMAQGEMIK